jgi:hypothetical protein
LGLLQGLAKWQVEKVLLAKKEEKIESPGGVGENIPFSRSRDRCGFLLPILVGCKLGRRRLTLGVKKEGIEGSYGMVGEFFLGLSLNSPDETSGRNELTLVVGQGARQGRESVSVRNKPCWRVDRADNLSKGVADSFK